MSFEAMGPTIEHVEWKLCASKQIHTHTHVPTKTLVTFA